MDQSTIPTKGNLLAARNALSTARLGYELLDKKRNVLIHEIMQQSERARDIQSRLADMSAEAYAALGAACKDIGTAEAWRACAGVSADDALRIRERSVMGVLIPIVNEEPEIQNPGPPYAIVKTSASLDIALLKFKNLKALVLELSMVENAAYRLAVAIKKTQKRANALENIIIPKYEALVKYISETLEERDRDEFTRLKVIKRSRA